jgi:hypothetical protein
MCLIFGQETRLSSLQQVDLIADSEITSQSTGLPTGIHVPRASQSGPDIASMVESTWV